MSQKSGSLGRYFVIRLAMAVPMVLILLTLVFFMLRVAPGDPVTASAGGAKMTAEQIAAKRHAAGFDRPLINQYGEYLGNVVKGDFGTTISDHRKVTDIIVENGGATLTLALAALFVALVVGLPLGLLAGRYRDTGFDVAIRLFGIVTYAAPAFVLGALAQIVFVKKLGWLDDSSLQASPLIQASVPTKSHILIVDAAMAGDWNAVHNIFLHLILPSVTLGLIIVGVFIRMVRVNLIQTLRGDYVEAARARGIREHKVVTKHAFRNALIPVITVIGMQVALLLGGSVLTEKTFSWPGLGNQLINYLNARDYIAVQGIVTFIAVVVIVIGILIDFVNALIDPRVRY
ncbi:ABC transporter permease [Yinghuangia seranimata]|uniref:ABC transporter permease n=1 Tax=Yinghuangia seranimata TaxID=408067 RepID=UPI00248BD749|nr:ABC transporter permease [Yinghuangia seranimata]MDI2131575.1 ABC transporter permease [Yinghuangia seranimata]